MKNHVQTNIHIGGERERERAYNFTNLDMLAKESGILVPLKLLLLSWLQINSVSYPLSVETELGHCKTKILQIQDPNSETLRTSLAY